MRETRGHASARSWKASWKDTVRGPTATMSEQNVVDAAEQFGGDGFDGEDFDGGGSDTGAASAPGMGQSKSSRRRRRKRKNKLMAAATTPEAGVAPGAIDEAAAA